jgi:hypothetical protein
VLKREVPSLEAAEAAAAAGELKEAGCEGFQAQESVRTTKGHAGVQAAMSLCAVSIQMSVTQLVAGMPGSMQAGGSLTGMTARRPLQLAPVLAAADAAMADVQSLRANRKAALFDVDMMLNMKAGQVRRAAMHR